MNIPSKQHEGVVVLALIIMRTFPNHLPNELLWMLPNAYCISQKVNHNSFNFVIQRQYRAASEDSKLMNLH
jgi:hypothetical protein